jgi:glycerophosphoryl diester phosphodiesterase
MRASAAARATPLAELLAARCRERPLVVGHRGAAATHPENTLVSFAAALDAGAELVELDYRETRDGVPVCLHDATLDRTTDARARFGGRRIEVAGRARAELLELDAGSWKHARFAGARIPSLADALAAIQPRGTTMIEHKAGTPATLVALLREHGRLEDVLVQSFDWDWLASVHALEPRLTIGALGSRRLGAARLAALPRTGASFVHWASDALRVDDVAALHAAGYLLCVYTVDADLELVGASAGGVEMITTNRPARLRALVDCGAARRPPAR